MKACLVNYCYDPEWLKEYALEATIYDRSDDGVERDLTKYGAVYKTPNLGDVDADKLGYLIENYDNLPDVFLWSKTNIFKYVDKDSLDEALKYQVFAPLFRKDHKTYSDKFGQVNYYQGIYHERADSWFFNAGLDSSGQFRNWEDWINYFNLPYKAYIPFAPGGSYILTKERVHRYSKDFYQKMRDTLTYAAHPVEAHCAERSYFLLWQ